MCVIPVLEEGAVLPFNPPLLSSSQFQSWSAAFSDRIPFAFYDSCQRLVIYGHLNWYFFLWLLCHPSDALSRPYIVLLFGSVLRWGRNWALLSYFQLTFTLALAAQH
ncbi:unnamed protein product [Prunus armeniaca]